MKLFIDANVLFTAAYSPQGKASLLIDTLHSVMVTSVYAAEEARRNILAKKPDALVAFETLIDKIEFVQSAQSGHCPIELPRKDQPIFLAALKSGATHLLTGDLKDFGPHMNRPERSGGILIQTVNDFIDSQLKS
jgi:predicted nucleic acid-binding protein